MNRISIIMWAIVVITMIICATIFFCFTKQRSPVPAENTGITTINGTDTNKNVTALVVDDRGHVIVVDEDPLDTLVTYYNGCAATIDSLKKVLDSVKNKRLVAEYKLERVQYYLNITLRDASQDKFLKGWIRRVLE